MANKTTLNSTDCYGRSYFRIRHYLSLQTTNHKLLVTYEFFKNKTQGKRICGFVWDVQQIEKPYSILKVGFF